MSTAFLPGLNRGRYDVLLNDLHKYFRMGREKYPKTLTAAVDLEINWKGDRKGSRVAPNYGMDFVTESQEADLHATNRMKITRSGNPVICHVCSNNHYANMCPDREQSASKKSQKSLRTPARMKVSPQKVSVNVTIGEDWGDDTDYGSRMFYQVTVETATNKTLKIQYQHALRQSGGNISPTLVLLENQSTVDVFLNRCLLKNTRRSNRELGILSTGGHITTHLKGGIPGYGTVCFHPGDIANILSLSKVVEKYRVAYNSTGETKFVVYLPFVEVRQFKQC